MFLKVAILLKSSFETGQILGLVFYFFISLFIQQCNECNRIVGQEDKQAERVQIFCGTSETQIGKPIVRTEEARRGGRSHSHHNCPSAGRAGGWLGARGAKGQDEEQKHDRGRVKGEDGWAATERRVQ